MLFVLISFYLYKFLAKSPILSHVTTTVHGLSTIRAFSAQEILINEFDNIQDKHSSAWFLFLASSRCFGLWLDVICIIFITVAVLFMVAFKESKY